jgi:spermidine synthase
MPAGRQIVEPMGQGLSRLWDVDEVLFETRTKYQELLIGRTAQGVSLFCDNERQSTEATQLVYHEALMVPAMLLARQVRRVLVIGSSEGVASRLAVAEGAELVDHVDIDEVAVRACAEHLPYGYTRESLAAAERGEGPVRVHYQDGFTFLAEATRRGDRYDVIVIDLPDENTDPEAQHNRLYGTEFLFGCGNLLTENGVVTCQAGCPTMWRNETLLSSWRRFNLAFGTVVYFGSDEHEWAFLTGHPHGVDEPISVMRHQLYRAKYKPSSIDEAALAGCTIPPHSVRHAGHEG